MKRLKSLYSFSPVVFCLSIILGLLATTSLVLGISELSPTRAQAPACDPTKKPPVRTPDPSRPFFRQNDIVYVMINSNITSQAQKDQIGRGLTSWGNVDTQPGGSGVTFVIGPPPANGPFPGDNLPTVIYFENGNLGRIPYASTVYGGTHADGSLATATITFNTSARTAELASDPTDGPFYDSSKPGYDTVFQKETEHEIGHPMGLGDATGTNQETVMNRSAFDCPNDACGIKPTEVSPCDKAAASEVSRPPDPGNGPGGAGGGGGGGGGTGDCPCGDCAYGCGGSGGGDGTNCDLVDVGGQCYAGVTSYDYYGVENGHEDGYCDPPQSTYVCW